jgi:hypothetical protein
VLEVPHQRRGIEKADGGDAQAGLRGGGHALLEYQSGAKGAAAAADGHESTPYARKTLSISHIKAF